MAVIRAFAHHKERPESRGDRTLFQAGNQRIRARFNAAGEISFSEAGKGFLFDKLLAGPIRQSLPGRFLVNRG